MGLNGKNVEEKIWNYLSNKIGNSFGVAGLMGNLKAESGLRPNNLEDLCEKRLQGKYTDETYTAAVDSGKISRKEFLNPLPGKQYGYGLAQWTSPGRKAGLYDLAKKREVSIADLEVQLDWLWSEINMTYQAVLKVLKSAKTVREASDVVLTKFECPAGTTEETKTYRAGLGQVYYDKYAKRTVKVTEKQVRQRVLGVMQGWVGLSRASGTHKVIIDTYNNCKPLARGYQVSYKDAYCATTISAAGIKAGLADIIPRECGCEEMIKLFQKLGRWKENDDYVPDIADIIFYDWDDNGKGDCIGVADHVGMIEEVLGGVMTVVEGNMNGGVVGRRKIAINARYIRGFGIPDYASKATVYENKPQKEKPQEEKPKKEESSSNAPSRKPKWVGKVTASSLNVRIWAGKEYPNIKSWPQLNKGNLVDVCDSVKDSNGVVWYFVRIAGKVFGFVHGDYIARA